MVTLLSPMLNKDRVMNNFSENGGLQVTPGSHKPRSLNRMVNQPNGRPGIDLSAEGLENDVVDVAVKAGDVVFFSGYLLHASGRNLSETRSRDSIVFHYMSSNSVFPYKPDESFGGVRKEQGDFRDIFPISGIDPYEWKGYEEIHKPLIQKPDNNLY